MPTSLASPIVDRLIRGRFSSYAFSIYEDIDISRDDNIFSNYSGFKFLFLAIYYIIVSYDGL